MKKIIYLVIISLFAIVNAKASDSSFESAFKRPYPANLSKSRKSPSNNSASTSIEVQLNSIAIENIVIQTQGYIVVNGVRTSPAINIYNLQESNLVSTFGNPDSRVSTFSEMDNSTIVTLSYGNNKFYFIGGHLLGIDMMDARFKLLGVGSSRNYSVGVSGTRISTAADIYTQFTDWWNRGIEKTVSIPLTQDGVDNGTAISFIMAASTLNNTTNSIRAIVIQ
jgi:hypothetical protein